MAEIHPKKRNWMNVFKLSKKIKIRIKFSKNHRLFNNITRQVNNKNSV